MSPFQIYIGVDREILKYSSDIQVNTAEITYFLNKAINEYIDEKSRSIDSIEEIRQALKGLIDSGTASLVSTTSIDSDSNRNIYSIGDSDTRLLLSERVAVTFSDLTSANSSVLPVTLDQLNIKLNDPFSMHFERMNTCRPLRYLEGTNVILVSDANVTLGEYSYIRLLNPTPFTISSASDTNEYTELPLKAHSEIITKTARMIIDAKVPERYERYSIEELKSKQ